MKFSFSYLWACHVGNGRKVWALVWSFVFHWCSDTTRCFSFVLVHISDFLGKKSVSSVQEGGMWTLASIFCTLAGLRALAKGIVLVEAWKAKLIVNYKFCSLCGCFSSTNSRDKNVRSSLGVSYHPSRCYFLQVSLCWTEISCACAHRLCIRASHRNQWVSVCPNFASLCAMTMLLS